MSSQAVSSTSTPLYRVFRGLKSTQAIIVPATEAEWLVTLNDFKSVYLAGRWKECEAKCTRLLEASKNKPVIHPYLLFLIGSCVEIHARNMHQYSAGKGKKLKEAADWFEKCEKALPLAMTVPCLEPATIVTAIPSTPMSRQGFGMAGVDDSPLTAFGERDRLESFPFTHHDEKQTPSRRYSFRSSGMASSLTGSSGSNMETPFPDETDPFVSLTPESDLTRARLDNWSIPPPPMLAPAPLRIRKVKADNTPKTPVSDIPQFTTIPSPLSQASPTNGIHWPGEDDSSSPLRGVHVSNLEDTGADDYDPFADHHFASTRYNSFGAADDDPFGRDMDDAVDLPTSPTLSFKHDSFDEDSRRYPTLEREDSSLWFKNLCSSLKPSPLRIRKKGTQVIPNESESPESRGYPTLEREDSSLLFKNCCSSLKPSPLRIRKKGTQVIPKETPESRGYPTLEREDSSLLFKNYCSSLTPSPLRVRPKETQETPEESPDSRMYPMLEREDSSLWFKNLCSSLKPSPLRIRKKTQVTPVETPDSDSISLARLQRYWEISSFEGTYATDSDAHSLHAVESTWAPLSKQYHAAMAVENERLQALRERITRYNHHLTSLSNQLQETVRCLHQLAMDIDLNRTTHIEARRIQPTKSYWSFAMKNDAGSSADANNDGDDYDEHRDKPEMKANLNWAAPGTILNETKQERIERLRAGKFETVGMQNEKRGHKGRGWYLDLCEDVLDDIEGLMRGIY